MNNFLKRRNLIRLIKRRRKKEEDVEINIKDKINIPQHLFTQCPNCGSNILTDRLKELGKVCPDCDYHFSMGARERLDLILDPEYEEIQRRARYRNPLSFPGYKEKMRDLVNKTDAEEAVVVARGTIDTLPLVAMAMDAAFMMGSMGTYVGEQITRGFEMAGDKKWPVIIFSASGGARMQEGILSLMQMAKTAGAVREHGEKGLLFISCVTHPTTGGVTASFASLGDIILAEPNALVGFAGQRVIEQTIGEKLPEGFQRSEFMQKHGFIDAVIHRQELKTTLARLIALHSREKKK